MVRLWFVTLIIWIAHSLALDVLDLSIDGLPHRVFPNVSMGLAYDEYERTCQWSEDSMSFTPNRRLQKDTLDDAAKQQVQLAIILAVGGHSNSYYDYGPHGSINGLMAVWDSWLEHFFSHTSNSTSLVLLFDERDFLRQNYTTSKHAYLDNIVMHNMGAEPVDCVHLRRREGATIESVYSHHEKHGRNRRSHGIRSKNDHGLRFGGRGGGGGSGRIHPGGGGGGGGNRQLFGAACSNELHLDQGYRMYYIDVANADSVNQKPLIIFASVYDFPLAEWVKKEEEEKLFQTWKPWRLPGRYPTNYAYIKMTNWYSYHMLNLQVLDFFDYGGKLDNDVSFVAPFPEPNLPQKLAQKNTKMLVTQNGWYYDDPRVAQGVHSCLISWIHDQSKLCHSKKLSLKAGGIADPTFWESNLNATFRAHFLTFWFGLYTAPQTKALAKYWNYWHPRGMWDYRWGDQQWWPRPISMFGTGQISEEIDHYDLINTDNNKYLVHKLWPRYGTVNKGSYFNVSGSTRLDRDLVYNITSKPFIY